MAESKRVIGVDGAFLKTYLGGVLLCTVGKDPNNQMYPKAWAVVEVENLENWSWFLRILMEDMGLGEGAGTTFISDQQKLTFYFDPLSMSDIFYMEFLLFILHCRVCLWQFLS